MECFIFFFFYLKSSTKLDTCEGGFNWSYGDPILKKQKCKCYKGVVLKTCLSLVVLNCSCCGINGTNRCLISYPAVFLKYLWWFYKKIALHLNLGMCWISFVKSSLLMRTEHINKLATWHIWVSRHWHFPNTFPTNKHVTHPLVG